MKNKTEHLNRETLLFNKSERYSETYLKNLEKFNRGISKIKLQREVILKKLNLDLKKKAILNLNIFIIANRLKYIIGISLLLFTLILGTVIFNAIKSYEEYNIFTRDNLEEISKMIYTIGYSSSFEE